MLPSIKTAFLAGFFILKQIECSIACLYIKLDCLSFSDGVLEKCFVYLLSKILCTWELYVNDQLSKDQCNNVTFNYILGEQWNLTHFLRDYIEN